MTPLHSHLTFFGALAVMGLAATCDRWIPTLVHTFMRALCLGGKKSWR